MTASAHVRTDAKAYRDGQHVGPGPWLELVKTCNGIRPGTFLAPTSTGPWWAGGSVEEYPDARILHRGDGTVSVVATTDEGAAVIRAAAAELGLRVAAS